MNAKTRAKLNGLANYALELLREPSSKRGLVCLLSGIGAIANPEQAEAIIAAGLMVAGAIGILTRDAK